MDERRFLSGVIAGAAALAVSFLLQLVLAAMLDAGVVLLLLSLLAPLPGLAVTMSWLSDATWRLACGAALLLLLPFLAATMPESRLLGLVSTTTVEEAPAEWLAAALVLPGAAPDERRQRRVANPAGGQFMVAPVFGAGWSRSGAVRMAAVQDLAEGAEPAPWALPGGMLKLLHDDARSAAVRAALAETGLQAAPDIVIGRWTGQPGRALLDAATPVLLAYGAGVVAWVTLLSLRSSKPLRGRARRR
ncbi:hypothetical protein [Falsiroseomonas sp. HW251]|uniref:hypothetical protein n=1 Tax=Falsiroseomonas sp. HW251 TaxID=3390998 RepID=UPI003D3228A0